MRFFTRLSVLALALMAAFTVSASAVGTEVPADPYVTGGYFISGYDSSFGSGTIYVSDSSGWCYKDGYLFRCGSTSASGVIVRDDGSVYTFSASAFSLPRYRNSDSSYSYTDLYFSVDNTNVQIQTGFQPYYSMNTWISFIMVFELGLIAVLLMTRR